MTPSPFLGLLALRPRWGLTARGCLLLLGVVIALGFGAVRGIHPFLAVDEPAATPVVVVEAWVPPAVLKGVVDRFGNQSDHVFYCVGGPTDKAFDSIRVDDTSAAEAVKVLGEYGIVPERLHVVPCWGVPRDRTYASAIAMRDWFKQHGVVVAAVNVVTEGPHSRRSRLLFEKAFGGAVEMGIVSIPDRTYEAGQWWRYSEGIKAVISETAGYLYARFLFQPAED